METEDFSKEDQVGKQERIKNWPVGDIVIATLVIIYAIFMFIGALYFPHRARMGFITSAKFTPMLLSILIIILCCILIFRTIRTYGKVSMINWWKELIADETMKRSLFLIIIIGLYIYLIGRLPFLFINTIYLFVIYWYLKIGSWKIIIVYSIAGGLIVSWIVPYMFQMPLP